MSNFMKIGPVVSSCYTRADGRMDATISIYAAQGCQRSCKEQGLLHLTLQLAYLCLPIDWCCFRKSMIMVRIIRTLSTLCEQNANLLNQVAQISNTALVKVRRTQNCSSVSRSNRITHYTHWRNSVAALKLWMQMNMYHFSSDRLIYVREDVKEWGVTATMWCLVLSVLTRRLQLRLG